MISREESKPLMDLQQLVAGDLTQIDRETLIQGVKDAEQAFDRAQEWSGRLLAEMKRRGLSWPALARLTGVPQTTLIRRARPYLGPISSTTSDGTGSSKSAGQET